MQNRDHKENNKTIIKQLNLEAQHGIDMNMWDQGKKYISNAFLELLILNL